MSDTQPTPASLKLAPLSRLAVVEVLGSGAEQFLQGQISANVAHANDHFAPLGVFCTPKGRVIANAQLLRAEKERYWLLCTHSIAPTLHVHLKKYAVFFKAELSIREDIRLTGSSGPARDVAAWWHFEALPQHPGETVAGDDQWAIKAAGDSRWLMVGYRQVEANQPEASWWQEEIRQGVAWLEEDQSSAWLPQMLNWEALGGISFKKGCYTGQEVVARAHYRGQVKKRLAHLVLAADARVSCGDNVVDLAREKSIGSVIAVEQNTRATDVLAVISLSDEPRELAINDSKAQQQALPYQIDRLDPESLVETAMDNA